jgi:hypothetical protein
MLKILEFYVLLLFTEGYYGNQNFKKISAGEMSNIFVYNNLKVTAKMLKMLKLMQYGCNT